MPPTRREVTQPEDDDGDDNDDGSDENRDNNDNINDEVRRIEERQDREDGSNLYVWDQPEIRKLRAQDSMLDALATDYNLRTQREYDEQLEQKDRD